MRVRLTLITLVAAAVVALPLGLAPSASAWRQADGNYWDIAAGSKRPSVVVEVKRNLAIVGIDIRRCGGLSLQYLRQRAIEVERRRFDITAPLPSGVIRLGRPSPRDRVRVTGRWTSPRTVVGRYRMWRTLVNRRTHRIRRCDTNWVTWRAALYTPVDVSIAWPAQFPAPGSVTASVSVTNAGDFPSPHTLLQIVPTSQLSGPDDPPPPPMDIATEQGVCRWPVDTEDHGQVIECALGTVAARRTVTVTITEFWDERLCGYSASWPARVRSPLNWYRAGEEVYGSEWEDADEPNDAEASCPEVPEPAAGDF